MQLVKDSNKGVFPGISVQLFDFETPVSAVATIACHALPGAWGCFHLPNEAGTKTMIFHLEDSPFCKVGEWNEIDESTFVDNNDEEVEDPNYDPDSEEFRPHGGDVFIFNGNSDAMWAALKADEDAFINSLQHIKLDQSKKFSASILELHEKGLY